MFFLNNNLWIRPCT